MRNGCNNDVCADAMAIKGVLENMSDMSSFFAVYQPIIDYGQEKKIVGFEALARLKHKKHGTIYPAKFIPVISQMGKLNQLSYRIISEAIQFVVDYNHRNNTDVFVSLNISPNQISDSCFVKDITRIVGDVPSIKNKITIEITEEFESFMSNSFIQNIRKLRRSGFKVALDDFGSGFFSLISIVELTYDYLKIDKKTVARVSNNKDLKNILSSFVRYCNSNNITVISEGVETKEQIDTLMDLNINIYQGYYFSQPIRYVKALDYTCC
ncbi:EAL domain-containing protein [Photobacterium alginatilyticum]|nr:EAL domain-containing protein [Photobacterium alginatilyticum]